MGGGEVEGWSSAWVCAGSLKGEGDATLCWVALGCFGTMRVNHLAHHIPSDFNVYNVPLSSLEILKHDVNRHGL